MPGKVLLEPLSLHLGELGVRGLLVVLYLACRYGEPSRLTLTDWNQWSKYAHPYRENPKVPSSMLLGLVLGVSGAVGMTGLMMMKYAVGKRVSWRALFAEIVVYFYGASLVFLLAACATNLLKLFVGRMRPDFLNRCFPDIFDKTKLPPLDFSLINSPYPACDHGIPSLLRDGRKSFPSGHSSYFASVCGFGALYIRHVCALARFLSPEASETKCTISHRPGVFARGLDLSCTLGLGILLPCWVGSTRVVDRRHHPTDVLAGLLIGWVLAGIVFVVYYKGATIGNTPPLWGAVAPSAELLRGFPVSCEMLQETKSLLPLSVETAVGSFSSVGDKMA